MASEYYSVQTGGRDRRAFFNHAKTRATSQIGMPVHRFSLDGTLAIVKVERGTTIGGLGRHRGPLNVAQVSQFIDSNIRQWVPLEDEIGI